MEEKPNFEDLAVVAARALEAVTRASGNHNQHDDAVVAMIRKGVSSNTRQYSLEEISKMAEGMKPFTEVELIDYVEKIPTDHLVNPAILANFSGKLMEMSPSQSLRVIIPFLFGNADSLEFMCSQWLLQLDGYFITNYSALGVLECQLHTLMTARWDPAIGHFIFSSFFYPFGIRQKHTGYLATSITHISGLKNAVFLRLGYDLVQTFYGHWARSTYFLVHKDDYPDGENIGAGIFECFRPVVLFSYFALLMSHVSSTDDQNMILGIFAMFCEAHPEAEFTRVLSDVIRKMNDPKSKRELHVNEWREALIRKARDRAEEYVTEREASRNAVRDSTHDAVQKIQAKEGSLSL